jgi:WD40 repeat protein
VTALAFSPKARLLARGGNAFAQLWDLNGGQANPLAKLALNRQVYSVAFSPNGNRLVTAEHSGYMTVWDLATEKKVWQCQLPGPIYKAQFAPDGRHLVTCNSNGTIYILRLEALPGA